MDFEDLFQYPAEFIRTFDASLDARLWVKLLDEETLELENAIANEPKENILKELADVIYVLLPAGIMCIAIAEFGMAPDSIIAQLEVAQDRFEKAKPTLMEMFQDESVIYEAVKRVHLSNMSKLGEDGKPIKREDGKILKGPNYKAPDLSDLV